MKKIALAIHRFFKELQRADIKTRKRWLVLLSSVSMILIVALWVLYSRVAFPSYTTVISENTTSTISVSATSTAETATQTTPHPSQQGNSVFDTLGRGITLFGEELQNGVRTMGDVIGNSFKKATENFKKTNSFELQTPTNTQNETSTAPAPIPPTPLP